MAKTSLPPGFRFHPTDVELVKYYLKRKVMGRKLRFKAIAEVDIYKYAPWDLPEKSCLRSRDLKWYFFCPREKKYSNGTRTNRATEFGFWKTTGNDRFVLYNNEVVGMVKTLVFHRGKAPKGDRTDWVMHEYRIQENGLAERGIVQDAFVLCSVFQKEGPGPRNGAQYGAPFREEDWDDDDEDTDCMEVVSSAFLPPVVSNPISMVATGSHVPGSQCVGTSESCLSDTIPSTYKVPAPGPTNNNAPKEFAQTLDEVDILSMLDKFTEDSMLISNENDQNEKPETHAGNIESPTCLDGIDIFKDLGDLSNLTGLSGDGHDFFANDKADYNLNGGSLGDNVPFIELCDLDTPLNCSTEAHESTDELYTGRNCYIPEFLSYQVNPCSSHSPPMLPEVPTRFEDQLALNCSTEAHESEIRTDEVHTGENCYIPEFLSYQVNPCSSHSPPMLPEVPTRFEDQLAAYLKENSGWGNAKQTPSDHAAATLFKQSSEGSGHASENLNHGGSNYPW